jgi:hypothetical protein
MTEINFDASDIIYANRSLKWLSTDTEELYKKNLLENFQKLKQNGWVENEFDYTFNSDGFRCNNFSNTNNLMVLGDSSSQGIGIPLENMWAELVTQKLKINCANLSQSGGSLDTAFRLCLGWIDKIKPKIVILCCPSPARIEYLNGPDIRSLGYWTTQKNDFLSQYYKTFVLDENNIALNAKKNILAIEQLCSHHQSKFIFTHHEDIYKCDFNSLARDLQHSGVNANKIFAEKILEIIS